MLDLLFAGKSLGHVQMPHDMWGYFNYLHSGAFIFGQY